MKSLTEIAAFYPGCRVPASEPSAILRTFGSMSPKQVAFAPHLGMALDIITVYGGGAVCRVCGVGSRVYYDAFKRTLDFGTFGKPDIVEGPIYEIVHMPAEIAEGYCTTEQNHLPNTHIARANRSDES